MIPYLSVITSLSVAALAQFPSPPTGELSVVSEIDASVSISYRELPTSFCETTPNTRSFSGYVHLPQSALTDLSIDFDINTFFLYFEAREDAENAPLMIYLAGGPGESSTFVSLSGEGGPCYVNLDGNSTTLNEWSFNNHANVLYIDQPVGAGYSYTSLVNGTFNVATDEIIPLEDYDGDVPENNLLIGTGTYNDPTYWKTTNTSTKSAQALWHFAEHWLTQFPEYKSTNKHISIWGNSHGGFWAPATAARIHQGINSSPPNSPIREWSLDNVGIVNGVIDLAHDLPFWSAYQLNNTYKALISEETWSSAQKNFTKEEGCLAAMENCRVMAEELDSAGAGTDDSMNEACRQATAVCIGTVGATLPPEIYVFDIAVSNLPELNRSPCPYYLPVMTYLNQDWTQRTLGVPLNFTYISKAVLQSYTLDENGGEESLNLGTGDAARASSTKDLQSLIQDGVKISLVYGDRDARCPWLAAEAIVPALLSPNLSSSGGSGAAGAWHAAGYENIKIDNDEPGGVVKQVGSVSFSRVFQAGHTVNAYAPATVRAIFARTIAGMDVATGAESVVSSDSTRRQQRQGSDLYATVGPRESQGMFNETLPASPPQTCVVDGKFQDESAWTSQFELMITAAEGNATNAEDGDGQGSPDEGVDSSSAASSLRLQMAGWLALLLVTVHGVGFIF